MQPRTKSSAGTASLSVRGDGPTYPAPDGRVVGFDEDDQEGWQAKRVAPDTITATEGAVWYSQPERAHHRPHRLRVVAALYGTIGRP